MTDAVGSDSILVAVSVFVIVSIAFVVVLFISFRGCAPIPASITGSEFNFKEIGVM